MMDTIDYHPAGRQPQRVICFSPHPDDDVISMGGTLIRLVEDRHEVHVAYMTSGNIAVFDHDAWRFADFVAEFNRLFRHRRRASRTSSRSTGAQLLGAQERRPARLARGAEDQGADPLERGQGRRRWWPAAGRDLHFLDLPFYRTGTIAKKPITGEDVRIIRELIERLEPAQIYVAGELSDPHGTHRVCAEAIFRALDDDRAGRPRPEVWLYRGAWEEWEPHEIDIAVPLSPQDLERKRAAIFRHQSQKDSAMFPGPDDRREFWQRAEDRNRNTAILYNQIGLPEYFALEGFVRWNGVPI